MIKITCRDGVISYRSASYLSVYEALQAQEDRDETEIYTRGTNPETNPSLSGTKISSRLGSTNSFMLSNRYLDDPQGSLAKRDTLRGVAESLDGDTPTPTRATRRRLSGSGSEFLNTGGSVTSCSKTRRRSLKRLRRRGAGDESHLPKEVGHLNTARNSGVQDGTDGAALEDKNIQKRPRNMQQIQRQRPPFAACPHRGSHRPSRILAEVSSTERRAARRLARRVFSTEADLSGTDSGDETEPDPDAELSDGFINDGEYTPPCSSDSEHGPSWYHRLALHESATPLSRGSAASPGLTFKGAEIGLPIIAQVLRRERLRRRRELERLREDGCDNVVSCVGRKERKESSSLKHRMPRVYMEDEEEEEEEEEDEGFYTFIPEVGIANLRSKVLYICAASEDDNARLYISNTPTSASMFCGAYQEHPRTTLLLLETGMVGVIVADLSQMPLMYTLSVVPLNVVTITTY